MIASYHIAFLHGGLLLGVVAATLFGYNQATAALTMVYFMLTLESISEVVTASAITAVVALASAVTYLVAIASLTPAERQVVFLVLKSWAAAALTYGIYNALHTHTLAKCRRRRRRGSKPHPILPALRSALVSAHPSPASTMVTRSPTGPPTPPLTLGAGCLGKMEWMKMRAKRHTRPAPRTPTRSSSLPLPPRPSGMSCDKSAARQTSIPAPSSTTPTRPSTPAPVAAPTAMPLDAQATEATSPAAAVMLARADAPAATQATGDQHPPPRQEPYIVGPNAVYMGMTLEQSVDFGGPLDSGRLDDEDAFATAHAMAWGEDGFGDEPPSHDWGMYSENAGMALPPAFSSTLLDQATLDGQQRYSQSSPTLADYPLMGQFHPPTHPFAHLNPPCASDLAPEPAGNHSALDPSPQAEQHAAMADSLAEFGIAYDRSQHTSQFERQTLGWAQVDTSARRPRGSPWEHGVPVSQGQFWVGEFSSFGVEGFPSSEKMLLNAIRYERFKSYCAQGERDVEMDARLNRLPKEYWQFGTRCTPLCFEIDLEDGKWDAEEVLKGLVAFNAELRTIIKEWAKKHPDKFAQRNFWKHLSPLTRNDIATLEQACDVFGMSMTKKHSISKSKFRIVLSGTPQKPVLCKHAFARQSNHIRRETCPSGGCVIRMDPRFEPGWGDWASAYLEPVDASDKDALEMTVMEMSGKERLTKYERVERWLKAKVMALEEFKKFELGLGQEERDEKFEYLYEESPRTSVPTTHTCRTTAPTTETALAPRAIAKEQPAGLLEVVREAAQVATDARKAEEDGQMMEIKIVITNSGGHLMPNAEQEATPIDKFLLYPPVDCDDQGTQASYVLPHRLEQPALISDAATQSQSDLESFWSRTTSTPWDEMVDSDDEVESDAGPAPVPEPECKPKQTPAVALAQEAQSVLQRSPPLPTIPELDTTKSESESESELWQKCTPSPKRAAIQEQRLRPQAIKDQHQKEREKRSEGKEKKGQRGVQKGMVEVANVGRNKEVEPTPTTTESLAHALPAKPPAECEHAAELAAAAASLSTAVDGTLLPNETITFFPPVAEVGPAPVLPTPAPSPASTHTASSTSGSPSTVASTAPSPSPAPRVLKAQVPSEPEAGAVLKTVAWDEMEDSSDEDEGDAEATTEDQSRPAQPMGPRDPTATEKKVNIKEKEEDEAGWQVVAKRGTTGLKARINLSAHSLPAKPVMAIKHAREHAAASVREERAIRKAGVSEDGLGGSARAVTGVLALTGLSSPAEIVSRLPTPTPTPALPAVALPTPAVLDTAVRASAGVKSTSKVQEDAKGEIKVKPLPAVGLELQRKPGPKPVAALEVQPGKVEKTDTGVWKSGLKLGGHKAVKQVEMGKKGVGATGVAGPKAKAAVGISTLAALRGANLPAKPVAAIEHANALDLAAQKAASLTTPATTAAATPVVTCAATPYDEPFSMLSSPSASTSAGPSSPSKSTTSASSTPLGKTARVVIAHTPRVPRDNHAVFYSGVLQFPAASATAALRPSAVITSLLSEALKGSYASAVGVVKSGEAVEKQEEVEREEKVVVVDRFDKGQGWTKGEWKKGTVEGKKGRVGVKRR